MADIEWISVPTEKIKLNTYFNAMFALDRDDVAELANYIINPGIISSIFQSPSDWLSTLTYFPFDVAYNETDKQTLQIGSFASSISAKDVNPALQLYNLGFIFFNREYNNFLDMNGYTKIDLWLPYLGFVEVMPNEVMGKYLNIALDVDLNNGQGTYYLCVSTTRIDPLDTYPQYAGGLFKDCRIIGTYSVQLGYSIPLGSTDTADTYRNLIMGTVKAMAQVAETALPAVSEVGSVGTNVTSGQHTYNTTSRDPSSSRGTYMRESTTTQHGANTSQRNATTKSYSNAYRSTPFEYSTNALSAMHMSAGIDRVNNPATLMTGSKQVVAVVRYPVAYYPDNWEINLGKPVCQTMRLSEVGGYTIVGSVNVGGALFSLATSEEMAMISDALKHPIILPTQDDFKITFAITSADPDEHPLSAVFESTVDTTWGEFISRGAFGSTGVVFTTAEIGGVETVIATKDGDFTVSYNGVNVKPTDVLVNGGFYTATYIDITTDLVGVWVINSVSTAKAPSTPLKCRGRSVFRVSGSGSQWDDTLVKTGDALTITVSDDGLLITSEELALRTLIYPNLNCRCYYSLDGTEGTTYNTTTYYDLGYTARHIEIDTVESGGAAWLSWLKSNATRFREMTYLDSKYFTGDFPDNEFLIKSIIAPTGQEPTIFRYAYNFVQQGAYGKDVGSATTEITLNGFTRSGDSYYVNYSNSELSYNFIYEPTPDVVGSSAISSWSGDRGSILGYIVLGDNIPAQIAYRMYNNQTAMRHLVFVKGTSLGSLEYDGNTARVLLQGILLIRDD